MFQLARRRSRTTDVWPGFVDALATVVLVFIFLLLLFIVGQFYLSGVLLERHRALETLQTRVAALAETLSLEREQGTQLQDRISRLTQRLEATLTERDALRAELEQAEQTLTVKTETLELKLRELASLQADIAALRELRAKLESELGTAREEAGTLRDRGRAVQAELASAEKRTQLAQQAIESREIRIQELVAMVEERDQGLAQEQRLTADASARIRALQQQMTALNELLAALNAALESRERTIAQQQVEIEDLGLRLNIALVQRVQELARYRSEFFGRLREVLGDIPEIEIAGDRLRFQSELFFSTGSADIGPAGRSKLDKVAETIKEIAERIPADVDWVLMIEGHTDVRPIRSERLPSNWEL
jgi:chemotaxis protein MotB